MIEKPEFDMTVTHAAEHGTRRDLLVAMRRRLAAALEDDRTQSRDLSPIVMRLRELSAEIIDLDEREKSEETTKKAPLEAPWDASDL